MKPNRKEAHEFYHEVLSACSSRKEYKLVARELVKTDVFFLICYILKLNVIDNDFMYDLSKTVQENPDETLYLCAREHGKSLIITQGITIQDILKTPEVTIGLFMHTFTLSSDVLKKIRGLLERKELIELFPEILYDNPSRESGAWSDRALKVKKTGVENTLESWGFVDALPVSKHYDICIFDDICTDKSVNTEDMIKKTATTFEHAGALGKAGGRRRYIGTRYHAQDIWGTMIDKEIPNKVVIRPATDDGTPFGKPVYFSEEEWAMRKKANSPKILAEQYLLDPKQATNMGFDDKDLMFWDAQKFNKLNIYIVADFANKAKKRSDYTAIIVFGFGEDENYYIIDMYRDKLTPHQRANLLIDLHRKYKPIKVGIEQYGVATDIDYIERVQNEVNYRFKIISLKGNIKKEDRILKLQPFFKQNKIYLPHICIKNDWEGNRINLTNYFVHNEYKDFPFSTYDDMLDAMARMLEPDMGVRAPNKNNAPRIVIEQEYNIW